ncbi:hypothetical protein FQN57_003933 [Myotisia sp. PD_48]|nr:hypothetical protein FQN57_003933 [Myotisia sp. PD_48]
MAHEPTFAFGELSIHDDFATPSSGLSLEDDGSVYFCRDGRATDDVARDHSPRQLEYKRELQKRVKQQTRQSWCEPPHNPTPPITVPYHEDGHHTTSSSVDRDIEYPRQYQDGSHHRGRFVRNRRPSISFNPEVTLESGAHVALEEPLRNLRNNNSFGAEPGSPPRQMYASGASYECNSELARRCHRNHRHRDSDSSSERCPSQLSDCSTEDNDLPRPTSLTSLSTASPITEELRTPPESRRDLLGLPFQSSPNLRGLHVLEDETESWPNIGHPHSGNRAESLSFGRKSSLRHIVRPASRRSPNTHGRSPASAFLSIWNRDVAPSAPDDEGQVIGQDYVIGKQIGFGGFSTVKEAYKVKDDGETIRSAVKIVKKQLKGKSERENEQFQAEFDHEVRIWRHLSHPNILPLEAVYETDYATFCFTRLTTGGTLFDLVKGHRQGLPLAHAKNYTYQLACAIRYLHEDARVFHRDIKLENCLLNPAPETVDEPATLILCDFGMAEWMSTDICNSSPDPYDNPADRPPPKNIGPSDTSTSIAGSLEYASPELIMSNQGVLDPVVDMWALGVVAYALVVGSRPFQDSFAPRIQMNILAGRWDKEAVLKDGEGRQDRLDALELIQGCLEMDPAKRWTISDVLACRWIRDCVAAFDRPTHHSRWGF